MFFYTFKIEIQTLGKEITMLEPGMAWLTEDTCKTCGMKWGEGTDFEWADFQLGFEQGDSKF